jgi:hypothetical protein
VARQSGCYLALRNRALHAGEIRKAVERGFVSAVVAAPEQLTAEQE